MMIERVMHIPMPPTRHYNSTFLVAQGICIRSDSTFPSSIVKVQRRLVLVHDYFEPSSVTQYRNTFDQVGQGRSFLCCSQPDTPQDTGVGWLSTPEPAQMAMGEVTVSSPHGDPGQNCFCIQIRNFKIQFTFIKSLAS